MNNTYRSNRNYNQLVSFDKSSAQLILPQTETLLEHVLTWLDLHTIAQESTILINIIISKLIPN